MENQQDLTENTTLCVTRDFWLSKEPETPQKREREIEHSV